MKKQYYTLTSCALMAALMCALCPVALPIGPVSVTLSVLIMMLTVYVLGTKRALISCTVYLLLGAVGMPVFSNYKAGLAVLAGPTGGYLVGYLPMILISGLILEKTKRNLLWSVLGMVAGLAVLYLFGTVWFVFEQQCAFSYALSVCVYPFIPLDLAKLVVACVFGKLVYNALMKAKLLPE